MEVRPGQRSSTIAQAMAHNLSTIERDLDMFKPLLEARGEHELLATVEAGHEAMKVAYARFLDCFIHEIQRDVAHGHDHADADHLHGNERENVTHHPHVHPVDREAVLVAAEHAAHDAEKYETR